MNHGIGFDGLLPAVMMWLGVVRFLLSVVQDHRNFQQQMHQQYRNQRPPQYRMLEKVHKPQQLCPVVAEYECNQPKSHTGVVESNMDSLKSASVEQVQLEFLGLL
jgi:hypothetical protein